VVGLAAPFVGRGGAVVGLYAMEGPVQGGVGVVFYPGGQVRPRERRRHLTIRKAKANKVYCPKGGAHHN